MSPADQTVMTDPEMRGGASRSAARPLRASDLERKASLAAALLVGLGVIMWVAANWDGFGRYGRFSATGLALVVAATGALLLPRLRVPFLLVGHFAIGGLLALIGQTYQTGADPWSLFAIWAGLSLAFALAAQSDAVWSAWITVAMAGVALWAHNHGQSFFNLHADSRDVILAWAAIIGLCVPMSPWSPVRRLMGDTCWSWRIGIALALVQIVLMAITALWSIDHRPLFTLGLALCGGLMMLVTRRQPFDLVIAALVGIAIDTLLTAALVRVVFADNGLFLFELIGGSLLVGLGTAGIIAATATWLLRLYRKHAPALVKAGTASAEPRTPPWPILTLTAFGALIAAIPLLAFYILVVIQVFGGDRVNAGLLVPVLGVLTLGAAVIWLRKGKPGLFGNVFALIFALVGVIQIGFGAFRDLPTALAAMAMLWLMIALALVLPQRWLGVLLGLPASKLVGIAMMSLMLPGTVSAWLVLMRPSALAMPMVIESLLIVVLVALVVQPVPRLAKLTPFFVGWIVGALVVLALESGPALFAEAFGPGFRSGGQGFGPVMSISRAILTGIAILGVVWIGRSHSALRTPLLLAHGLALAVLVALVPALVVPAFVGLVMLAEGRKSLALLAGAIGLWIIGAFYYNLAWPLVTKGLVLITLGSVLVGLAAVLGRRLNAGIFDTALATGAPDPMVRSSGRSVQVLIAAGAICAVGLCSWSILSREHVLRTGRTVLVRIAPVDPRSLVQGDYMALAFELPQRRPSTAASTFGDPKPVAIGQVGADSVVTFTEIVSKRPQLASNSVAIALSVKNGNFVVGSDAWFFKEGSANRWAGARYGIFRVTDDGTALLAGLADEARRPIQ